MHMKCDMKITALSLLSMTLSVTCIKLAVELNSLKDTYEKHRITDDKKQ